MLIVPILTAERTLGVLVVARERGRRPFDDEESRLLGTFANQAAVAIERSLLEEQRARAELLARTDELKTALLSAVSHDLRTPLASIKASVTTLMQPDVTLTAEDRHELLTAIDEESDRLNRLVANLLDLSRIEAGALKPVREWYPIAQIVHEAVDRSALVLDQHPLSVDAQDALLVDVDYVMIAEVLANLIENAAKYSPPGAPVFIAAAPAGDVVEVRVKDAGAGVAPGQEERIFDKFYRVEAPNRPLGSGIGLAICKGFVEAHGGRIWVERNPEGGSTFGFTVPAAPDDAASAEQVPTAQLAEAPRP
jgi:two-component system sensor histidine kinase KdpD